MTKHSVPENKFLCVQFLILFFWTAELEVQFCGFKKYKQALELFIISEEKILLPIAAAVANSKQMSCFSNIEKKKNVPYIFKINNYKKTNNNNNNNQVRLVLQHLANKKRTTESNLKHTFIVAVQQQRWPYLIWNEKQQSHFPPKSSDASNKKSWETHCLLIL